MEFSPLTEADVRAIAAWVYPPPYDVYNLPDWDTVQAQGWALADPERRSQQFTAIRSGGALIGYYRIQRQGETGLLGLGLRPDLCGQGHGPAAVGEILTRLRGDTTLCEIVLEVRRFNQRAIRCYARCGFRPAGAPYTRDVLGVPTEFVRMIYRFHQA